MKLLQDILERNTSPDLGLSAVDIYEESCQWFYFDQIANTDDLELAWSIFPEQQEIRQRLMRLESVADIVPNFGYRLPKKDNRCALEDLRKLIEQQLRSICPLIPDRDYLAETRQALGRPFEIVLAPMDELVPDWQHNELRTSLYETIQNANELRIREDHYYLLYEWAVYLTKCDEVAVYLLWPCLDASRIYAPETPEAGFRLWSLDCRDRYWFKNNNPRLGVIHFRPPWLETTPSNA